MSKKGTCLQTYIPVRKEPASSSEMTSSLIFGESYSVLDSSNGFLKIMTDFDAYSGWISENTFSDYQEFNTVNDHIFIQAASEHQILFIPCGALIPDSGNIHIDGQVFKPERKLKTYHHLPLSLRIQKLASSFLNMPYLWGGRTFMGLDCSGFMQVVFKANGYTIPRDTSQQIEHGLTVAQSDIRPCDLVFFAKPDGDKVVHVGLILEDNKIIHSSAKVRIDKLDNDGIYIDAELVYKTIRIQRILK